MLHTAMLCVHYMRQWIKIALKLFQNLLMWWKPTTGCQRLVLCPLSIALISLYKDMVAILHYSAESEEWLQHMMTEPARKKRAVKARRKRHSHVEEDAQGPLDRNSDLHSPKWKTTKKVSEVVELVGICGL